MHDSREPSTRAERAGQADRLIRKKGPGLKSVKMGCVSIFSSLIAYNAEIQTPNKRILS